MSTVFKTKRRDGSEYPKWRFHYRDWKGRQQTGTGYESEAKTRRLADQTQAKHDRIRQGVDPAPSEAAYHRKTDINSIIKEYLSWGQASGGLRGFGWAEHHAMMKQRHLDFWTDNLGLKTMADFTGIFSKVERATVEMHEAGRHGKTIENTVESLRSFIHWGIKRKYSEGDPLAGRSRFNIDPERRPRPLTADELAALFENIPIERRLTYETALFTGLRNLELAALSINDLDVDRCELNLDAQFTKNRRGVKQHPLPRALVERLAGFAQSDKVVKLYRGRSGRMEEDRPEKPLLWVPAHLSRTFGSDCKKAGIVKETDKGVVTFRSLRNTFDALLYEAGCSTIECMELMRHHDPNLTLNRYGSVRGNRLTETVERLYHLASGRSTNRVQTGGNGDEAKKESVGSLDVSSTSDADDWWRRGELNPRPVAFR